MMSFKKCILLLLVAGFSVVRGRAVKKPIEIHKILVVQMAKLGDMVCTTPMFRALRTNFPTADLFVLGNALNRGVVAGNTDVTGYIVFTGIVDVFNRLRTERFDCAFLAGGPDVVSTAVSFLSGIPLIVSPRITGGESSLYDLWYRLTASFVVTQSHAIGTYAPREYLRLLEPVGITSDDTRKHLVFEASDEAHMRGVLVRLGIRDEDLLIGISPSSGNKIKQWPPERFAAVADHLIETYGAKIIIIGTERDTEEITDMMNYVKHNSEVHNAKGLLPIGSLKALMPRLRLFISVDTGPIYIAEAFDTATVDIVGPMDEREQPPRGPGHAVVVAPNRGIPALNIMNAHGYDREEAKKQTDAITTQMVIDACAPYLPNPIKNYER